MKVAFRGFLQLLAASHLLLVVDLVDDVLGLLGGRVVLQASLLHLVQDQVDGLDVVLLEGEVKLLANALLLILEH